MPRVIYFLASHPLICFSLCIAVFSAALAAAPQRVPAAGAPPKAVWRAGDMELVAIQDRPGEMALALFSGPAKPEERQKYFTDDKVPASINAFLLRSKSPEPVTVLVDAGLGQNGPGESGLLPGLASSGVTPEEVDFILLTHMHIDHIGGLLAGDKRVFPKAKIMVSAPELKYWLDLADKDSSNTTAALVKTLAGAYGEELLPPFAFGSVLLPGVTAIDASGHTPGHTAYLLDSGGRSILIVGDLVHAAALQFPLPEECARYDQDRDDATAARKRILALASEENIPIAGMHIPFPGSGLVRQAGSGFAFTPSSGSAVSGGNARQGDAPK